MIITPELLLSYLPPSPIIIEAGAYDGSDTLRFAVQAGHVYAFEPVPSLYAKLIETTASHSNITTYPLALGGGRGMRDMWISKGGMASSSFLTPKLHLKAFPDISFEDQLDVPVTTLEIWADIARIGHIDGMWLDMQGAELEALKAAGPLLDGVKAIVLEISIEELYEGMPLWPEVEKWLNKQGFRIVEIELETPQFGNALMIR